MRGAGEPFIFKQPLTAMRDRRDKIGHTRFVDVPQAAHIRLLKAWHKWAWQGMPCLKCAFVQQTLDALASASSELTSCVLHLDAHLTAVPDLLPTRMQFIQKCIMISHVTSRGRWQGSLHCAVGVCEDATAALS